MSELVKYHNDINKIPLRNFTDKELNLFFTIIYKAKDQGIKKMKFDFVELKKIASIHRADERLIKSLENMNFKMLSLQQRVETPSGVIHMFNLFSSFIIDPNNKFMEVEIHENFSYMLNDLPRYTKFELSQLVSLRSSYSKNMFRLLKQFESTKYFITGLDEFKRMLCIPGSYRTSDINKTILNPIMEELSPIFPNLKLEKVKKGRLIDKFIFTWGNRNLLNEEIAPGVQQKKIEEVKISEGLYRIFEKVKKNRFIKPLITSQNIAHLVNEYSEIELIEGLNFASSEIKTEIKSINYLIKTINTGIIKDEIKIVVKKTKPNDLKGVELRDEKLKGLTEEIKTLENVNFGKLFLKVSNQLIKTGKYEKLKSEFEPIKEIGDLKEFIEINNLEVKKI